MDSCLHKEKEKIPQYYPFLSEQKIELLVEKKKNIFLHYLICLCYTFLLYMFTCEKEKKITKSIYICTRPNSSQFVLISKTANLRNGKF